MFYITKSVQNGLSDIFSSSNASVANLASLEWLNMAVDETISLSSNQLFSWIVNGSNVDMKINKSPPQKINAKNDFAVYPDPV